MRSAGLERAVRSREQLGAVFSQLAPEPVTTGEPEGQLTGIRLGRLTAHEVSGTPQLVRRTPRAVRREPSDQFKICLQVSGRAIVHQDRDEVVIEPGQMVIYDTGRPYDLRLEGLWTCAVVAFPRDALGLPTRVVSAALLRAFPVGLGPGAVLSAFVAEAVRQAETIGRGAAERLGEAGLHLVAGTLSESGSRQGDAAADAARMRVLAYIRAHLDDPQLSHATVAAAHHMAPRTLGRLFEHEPLTVTGYIRSCRLEAVRRDLSDPLLADRSIAAIAARWCYVGQAHFTRAFRAQFGMTPSAVRRATTG
jgi:AraC-like DNA-binding protein